MGEVILSGIRASGRLHIGNYLGAIKNFVELSNVTGNTCLFFVANLHSLTTPPDPKSVSEFQMEIVRLYLACGINLHQSYFYLQHTVPELCAITWILDCHAKVAELQRLPTFKDKATKDGESGPSMGLLNYPVLMAADILGPGATYVPVGEDQCAHLELTCHLAKAVNNFAREYGMGEVLMVPRYDVATMIRVPGLDGSGKMGKSDSNSIDLLDDPNTVWEKLRVAVTDPDRKKLTDKGNPDVCNIYTLHNQTGQSPEVLSWVREGCQNAGIGCIDCKRKLAERINFMLAPIRERYAAIDEDDIPDILESGTKFVIPRVHEIWEKLCVLQGLKD